MRQVDNTPIDHERTYEMKKQGKYRGMDMSHCRPSHSLGSLQKKERDKWKKKSVASQFVEIPAEHGANPSSSDCTAQIVGILGFFQFQDSVSPFRNATPRLRHFPF